MPNQHTGKSVNEFAITVNDLEEVLGIDLFTRLSDKIEEDVEEQINLSDWIF